jgi:hypothetical protein
MRCVSIGSIQLSARSSCAAGAGAVALERGLDELKN